MGIILLPLFRASLIEAIAVMFFAGSVGGMGVTSARADDAVVSVDLRVLNTIKSEEQLVLARSVDKRRSYEAAILIDLLKSTTALNDTKCVAAYLLGRERMVEGIDALVAQITLRHPPNLTDAEALLDEYPSVDALAQIGTPCIPKMLQLIGTTDDIKKRELSLRIIRVVEGKDVTQYVLTQAVGKETDAKKKDRLQAALKLLMNEAK
jgi:hypothetical protein